MRPSHTVHVPCRLRPGFSSAAIPRDATRWPPVALSTRVAARAYRRTVANVGDLVPTTAGKWMTLAPKRCPNGHELGPGTLVGHRACSGPHRGGHTAGSSPGRRDLHQPRRSTSCTVRRTPRRRFPIRAIANRRGRRSWTVLRCIPASPRTRLGHPEGVCVAGHRM